MVCHHGTLPHAPCNEYTWCHVVLAEKACQKGSTSPGEHSCKTMGTQEKVRVWLFVLFYWHRVFKSQLITICHLVALNKCQTCCSIISLFPLTKLSFSDKLSCCPRPLLSFATKKRDNARGMFFSYLVTVLSVILSELRIMFCLLFCQNNVLSVILSELCFVIHSVRIMFFHLFLQKYVFSFIP